MSDQFNFNSSQSPPDASGSQAKSPLSLDLLKNLNDKKTTRDGNAPKRRGPKPDSKPALTRRQELNRQAQRTHRERKELYIKALEEEVLRLKEIYSSVAQDREKLVEENRLLKEALVQNGLNIPARRPGGPGGPSDDGTSNQGSNYGGPNVFSPGQASQSTAPSGSPGQSQGGYQNMTGNQLRAIADQSKQRGIDIEQAGIDFVLALEKPCMAHLPFLMDRANAPAGEPCGHALMASCPPAPYQEMNESRPWGNSHTDVKAEPNAGEGAAPSQGTWELSKADLATLLDLSGQLDLDGEITPVMAWGMIMSHPQFADLQAADFRRLAEELGSKVRCYGFGAVMEDFELRDAFESVRSTPVEMAY